MGVGEIVKMMEIWVRVRKNLEMGEEEGDEDDQGADGDGGLHPDEDVEAVGSRGGFQEGSRRGRRRTEEILLLVDNGVVFREEDQKENSYPSFRYCASLAETPISLFSSMEKILPHTASITRKKISCQSSRCLLLLASNLTLQKE